MEKARSEELHALRRTINDNALLKQASTANQGMKCWFDDSDPLGESRIGRMHVHLRVIFEDGTKWLARLARHDCQSFSDEITNQVLLDEYATLQWLADIGAPAPKLCDYGLRNDPKERGWGCIYAYR